MARRKINTVGVLPSSVANEVFVADVRGIDMASVSCFSRDGAWHANLRVRLQVSTDGDQWHDAAYVDQADGTETTVPDYAADRIRRNVPVFDVAFLRAIVAVAAGTTTIVVSVNGEGEELRDDNPATGGMIGGVLSVGGGAAGSGAGGAGGGYYGSGGGSASSSGGGGISFS